MEVYDILLMVITGIVLTLAAVIITGVLALILIDELMRK